MNHIASENYLVNEVMTATPEKLHLMLLDAAIRECLRARKYWEDKDDKEAGKCLMRAQRIMTGVLGGIDFTVKSDLVGKVANVYLFICESLTYAYTQNDADKLSDALRVLEIERETWRQMCDKLADTHSDWKPTDTAHAKLPPNLFSQDNTLPDMRAGSFSMDA